MIRKILETEQKALEINLDEQIYGAFAEIGAGQEVARHFFQAGAAAGTIAKTMSAYDKVVSDEIYGSEEQGKGRYVCESRLYKMLAHEYALMEGRLRILRPEQCFFSFADTVAAINYQRTIKGDGWLGIRFQLSPGTAPNDLVLHVRLLDHDNRLQQQAVGILGVNMLYACYRYHSDPETLLHSLIDNLQGRVKIDMVRLKGPDFQHLDNRLLCLWLVKNQLSEVAIFGPDGDSLHAGEFLYKKSILVVRGSYRPPTLVQEDMIRCSYKQFLEASDVDPAHTFLLPEITLDNLRSDGALKERDFLDRAEILCALGQTVVISDCVQHKRLIAYFADYKIRRIGLAMGARKLENILRETCEANPDNLLVAFGEVFPRNVRFYIYPCLPAEARSAKEGSSTSTKFSSTVAIVKEGQNLITSQNLPIPQTIHFLYDHLLENGNIVDIQGFNPAILDIYHKEVLKMIQDDESGWEEKVPPEVARLVKEKRLFTKILKQIHNKMTLEEKVNKDILIAMKAKDEITLRGIRAIKSLIQLAKTDGTGAVIDETREVQMLQKLVKTRQESLDIYEKNNRPELAKIEREEIEVIRKYLPAMLEGAELEAIIKRIISETGAESARDMGKVMGAANKALAGKAEGRAISDIVKRLLS